MNELETFVAEVVERLGVVLIDGFTASVDGVDVSISETTPRAVKSGGRPCLVGCGRRAAIKGLCKSHAAKAKRSGLISPYTKGELARLFEDGRSRK